MRRSVRLYGAALVLQMWGCSSEPVQGPPSGQAGTAAAAGGAGAMPSHGGAGAMPSHGGAGAMPSNGGAGAMPSDGGAGAMPSDGGAGAGTGGVSTAGTSATGGAAGGTVDDAESGAALEQLRAWLSLEPAARPTLSEQAFASVPLTRPHASAAREELWVDHAEQIRATRAGEVGATSSSAKTLSAAGISMQYYRVVLGEKPASGFSLFISMHGGGGTDAATNDGQWRNQIALAAGYDPKNAIWVAPRAPTNEWNMWFREHMDALFERMIENMIVFEGVDANRVYLNGYSAGGDGAYQMGPRMADAWAGVGMSAGHPNEASPLSLRNTAFAIHVGDADTAYERNQRAADWGAALEQLALLDNGGYPHQWQVHQGLPHWMDLADAVSIPFLQSHTRSPTPSKVVWRQAETLRSRFYWLAMASTDVAPGAEVTATLSEQTIELSGIKNVARLSIRISDAMLDQDAPVAVEQAGNVLFTGVVPRRIEVLHRTLTERGDPELVFAGEVAIDLN